MLARDGAPEIDDVQRVMPSPERLAKGPVAIIECFQQIPCDPCHTACPRGAIKPFANINDLPQIDFDACDGCTLCVAACPGLAIFVVDYTYSDDKVLLKLPHEFVPLPEKGEIVKLLNRKGEVVAEGKVVRAVRFRDKTNVVWVECPRELGMEVRAIAPPVYEENNPLREIANAVG